MTNVRALRLTKQLTQIIIVELYATNTCWFALGHSRYR
ncbi:hypothetical protein VEx25_1415 [Vibrio antiquarius]|uniref:Uncharacterized protein n=1 Tax=Vibrio antiquarius (strain Ex25) TaxID=150340 RepID=A0ABM9WXA5_VIBAE|nr:hypothetical protein VEx25_1415 [Vibrio antiquarius]